MVTISEPLVEDAERRNLIRILDKQTLQRDYTLILTLNEFLRDRGTAIGLCPFY